jgi:hypothetical protein
MPDSELKSMGHHSSLYTASESVAVNELAEAFERSPLPLARRLQNFGRHVRRQDLARFLAKYELYKLALNVHGSVAECGVFAGGGIFAWYHFASILEPYNHGCRVIGFDTFEGFPDVAERDTLHGGSEHLRPGAFSTHAEIREEIESLAAIHDRNRPLGHIPRIELVAGDARETIPAWMASHPHLLLKLLYLDFDLYEPTRAALAHLLPRVVPGGIVAFDELNCAEFPGETAALIEATGLGGVRLRRTAIDPWISWFEKE